MLRTPEHLGLHARGLQRFAQRLADPGQERLAFVAADLDLLRQRLVGLGIEHFEAAVLEFALDAGHAQPVRERRVDVARLLGDAARALALQVLDGAHVVQAVGELDEDDAQVARHGQQHLAEVLGLRRLAAVEVQARQLGHALDQRRHLLAEMLLDVGERDLGVLDHVVQQRGARQRRVEPVLEQVEQDAAHLDHVRQVGLARIAALIAVRVARRSRSRRRAGHGPLSAPSPPRRS